MIRKVSALFCLVALVFFSILISRSVIVGQASKEYKTPVVSKTPRVFLGSQAYKDEIKGFQTAIAETDKEELKELYRKKMEIPIQNATAAMRSYIHSLTATPLPVYTLTTDPLYKVVRDPEGIENHLGPIDIGNISLQRTIHFTNRWRKWYPGTDGAGSGTIQAWAAYSGALQKDKTQGIVLLMTPSTNTTEGDLSVYESPRKSGALSIVSEQDGVLTLSSKNGDTFYFDYYCGKYVDDNKSSSFDSCKVNRPSVKITNNWIKWAPGKRGMDAYTSFGGVLRDDEAQGVVIFSILYHGGDRGKAFVVYPSPRKSGTLTILSEQDGVLTLSSSSGDTFYFDYYWGKYVEDGKPFAPPPPLEGTSTPDPYP